MLISHDSDRCRCEEIDLGNLPESQFVPVRRDFWPRMIGQALRADLAPVLVFAPRRNATEEIAQAIACGPPGARSAATLAGPGSARREEPDETLAEPCGVSSQRTQLRRARRRDGIARESGTTQRRRRDDGPGRRDQFFHALGAHYRTRYMAGNFERQVKPDELLQMFGRAGRRGLDETGSRPLSRRIMPRLSDARARQLKRATQVDWPSLISVMRL